MANTKARTALDEIHALLNGEEWDSDTTSAIATVIQEYGYTIYNPDIHGDEVANAPLPADTDYTLEHLEAAACMWEHVLGKLRGNWTYWLDYKNAHGMAALRATVIAHAPKLEAEYVAAVANGYDKDFDWDYVPKYMESHIAAILT